MLANWKVVFGLATPTLAILNTLTSLLLPSFWGFCEEVAAPSGEGTSASV